MNPFNNFELFHWVGLACAAVAGVFLRVGVFAVIPSDYEQWRVFSVNFIGCMMLAFWLALFQNNYSDSMTWILVVGFLGGFTTYSALLLQVLKISQSPLLMSDILHFFAVQLILPSGG